jgi:hypothetical protein
MTCPRQLRAPRIMDTSPIHRHVSLNAQEFRILEEDVFRFCDLKNLSLKVPCLCRFVAGYHSFHLHKSRLKLAWLCMPSTKMPTQATTCLQGSGPAKVQSSGRKRTHKSSLQCRLLYSKLFLPTKITLYQNNNNNRACVTRSCASQTQK